MYRNVEGILVFEGCVWVDFECFFEVRVCFDSCGRGLSFGSGGYLYLEKVFVFVIFGLGFLR